MNFTVEGPSVVNPAPGVVNVPLLRKVLEHITAHPDEWYQGWWAVRDNNSACGTACCVAGWTVQFTGHELVWTGTEAAYVKSGDSKRPVSAVAAEELGLNSNQAVYLFDGVNSLRTLWRIAKEFTHGEIEIPEDLR